MFNPKQEKFLHMLKAPGAPRPPHIPKARAAIIAPHLMPGTQPAAPTGKWDRLQSYLNQGSAPAMAPKAPIEEEPV